MIIKNIQPSTSRVGGADRVLIGSRTIRSLCAATIATGFAAQTGTVAAAPVGNAFQISPTGEMSRGTPGVARNAAGNWVVGWQPTTASGQDTAAIHLQRYDTSGNAAGGEVTLQLPTGQTAASPPNVAINSNGTFVATYVVIKTFGSSIAAQRFAADGTLQGKQIIVGSYTTNQTSAPTVAMDDDGDFAIGWEKGTFFCTKHSGQYCVQGNGSKTTYVRLYSSSGTARGPAKKINYVKYTAGRGFGGENVGLSMNSQGTLAAGWLGLSMNGTAVAEQADVQLFDKLGNSLTTPSRVDSGAMPSVTPPLVAIATDGQFVVSWSGADTNGSSVFFRQYAADGTALAGEQAVVSDSNAAGVTNVSVSQTGGFTLTYNVAISPITYYAQQFNSDGSTNGARYDISPDSPPPGDTDNYPVSAIDGAGNVVSVWLRTAGIACPGPYCTLSAVMGQLFSPQ